MVRFSLHGVMVRLLRVAGRCNVDDERSTVVNGSLWFSPVPLAEQVQRLVRDPYLVAAPDPVAGQAPVVHRCRDGLAPHAGQFHQVVDVGHGSPPCVDERVARLDVEMDPVRAMAGVLADVLAVAVHLQHPAGVEAGQAVEQATPATQVTGHDLRRLTRCAVDESDAAPETGWTCLADGHDGSSSVIKSMSTGKRTNWAMRRARSSPSGRFPFTISDRYDLDRPSSRAMALVLYPCRSKMRGSASDAMYLSDLTSSLYHRVTILPPRIHSCQQMFTNPVQWGVARRVRMDASRFGPWLGAELSQRGMSQAELARRLEASNGTVSSWVNSTRRPTPASCRKIAGVLRVPMDVALAMAGHRPLGPESWPVDVLEVAEM